MCQGPKHERFENACMAVLQKYAFFDIKVTVTSHNFMGEKNRNYTYLNPFQDGRVEDIHSCIYFVGHKFLGLFHEPINFSIFIIHHNSIFGWLLHFCHLLKIYN